MGPVNLIQVSIAQTFFLKVASTSEDIIDFIFLSTLYTQCGAQTHNLENKSHMLYRPSHPGTSRENFFLRES